MSFCFNQNTVHLPLNGTSSVIARREAIRFQISRRNTLISNFINNSFKMNQLLKTFVVFPIRLYKLFLSPLLGPSKCRYSPSCSQYMIDAILEWGILRGLFMGIKRIGRCHPWAHHDHFDPVPKRK